MVCYFVGGVFKCVKLRGGFRCLCIGVGRCVVCLMGDGLLQF